MTANDTSTASPAAARGSSPRRDEPALVFRPHASVVLAASALAVLLAILAGAGLAVAIGSVAAGDQTLATAALLEVVLVVPFVVLLWRQSRIRLEVGGTSLRAVNYFSSFRLRWQDVTRFGRGDGSIGIEAELRDGSTVRLSAVQQPRLSSWLGSPTDADEVVRELNRWLYRLRWETTSRRVSEPAGRANAERDDREHERGDGEPVPHEDREIAPS